MINQACNRRRTWAFAMTLCLLLTWLLRSNLGTGRQSARFSLGGLLPGAGRTTTTGGVPRHVDDYFDQAFSAGPPRPFAYAALKEACERGLWRNAHGPNGTREAWYGDNVYLQCGGMAAGMTTMVSQIKVCLKMALDTGTSLVLPSMPLRDSTDLTNFNFLNGDAYLTYDKWFDAEHLENVMAQACPTMRIIHPDDLDRTVPVRRKWDISCGDAPGWTKLHSYFWSGRPFRTFFERQYEKLKVQEAEDKADPAHHDAAQAEKSITVVGIDSEFMVYRITDDPTRRDLRLWNDLSHAVRFLPEQRQIIARLMPALAGRPYYGVHFRVEKDNIWSPMDQQLQRLLDALDRAWGLYGGGEAKPLVYLACGDQDAVETFAAEGKKRGWEVTHKWALADEATTHMINALPFDFMGVIDLGIMMRSAFFLGLTGSAFSFTVANQRDVTGHYRGSSFEMEDDEGARTHLFNDQDAEEYARCL